MNTPNHHSSTRLLLVCLLGSFFLSGYTFKSNRKDVDKDFSPPPYMLLVRQALVSKDLGGAARILKAARRCWQKRTKACGFHKRTYLLYLGVLTLQRGQFHRAIRLLQQTKAMWGRTPPKKTSGSTEHSKEALKAYTRQGKTLSFYLGQAYFRVKRYKEAVQALREAAVIVDKLPGYYRLLAMAQMKSKDYNSARSTLQRGLRLFPREQGMLQLATTLYVEVGAFRAALNVGRRLLYTTSKSNATPFLIAVDAMRQAGLIFQVLPLLEEARLRAPKNRDILLRLGIAYSRAQMPTAAAHIFASLTPKQPKMAYYTAAAWMQAGNMRKALFWNQQVRDRAKRVQQRSRILLGQGQFARAFVLLQRRWRDKKLPPHSVYRLAYVALRLGRYNIAQGALDSLKGTSYAASAAALETTLKQCRAAPWRCMD